MDARCPPPPTDSPGPWRTGAVRRGSGHGEGEIPKGRVLREATAFTNGQTTARLAAFSEGYLTDWARGAVPFGARYAHIFTRLWRHAVGSSGSGVPGPFLHGLRRGIRRQPATPVCCIILYHVSGGSCGSLGRCRVAGGTVHLRRVERTGGLIQP